MNNEKSTAFVPWTAIYLSTTPGTREEGELKVATLYYDRLVLPIGQFQLMNLAGITEKEEGLKTDELLQVWTSLDSYMPDGVSIEALRGIIELKRELLFTEELGDLHEYLRLATDDVISRRLDLSADAMAAFRNENWYAYVRESNALATTAIGSVLAWIALQRYLDCAYLAFSEVELAVANRFILRTPMTDEISGLLDPVEAYVPSVRTIPWRDVLKLRRDPRVQSFRQWLCSKANLRQDRNQHLESAVQELWTAFGKITPNMAGETIRGILGNTPIPPNHFMPINPFGIIFSILSAIKARSFKSEHKLLVFLHSMNQKSDAGR